MKDVKSFLNHKRNLISLLILLLILAALPAGVYLSQKTTIFSPRATESKKVVVLDNGHTSNETSPQDKRDESQLNLRVAHALKSLLERNGYLVVITRPNAAAVGDYQQDLLDRPRVANRANADVFVSIHFDRHTPTFRPDYPNTIQSFYKNNSPKSQDLGRRISEDLTNQLNGYRMLESAANTPTPDRDFAVIREGNLNGVGILQEIFPNTSDYSTLEPLVDKIALGYCNGISRFLDNKLCVVPEVGQTCNNSSFTFNPICANNQPGFDVSWSIPQVYGHGSCNIFINDLTSNAAYSISRLCAGSTSVLTLHDLDGINPDTQIDRSRTYSLYISNGDPNSSNSCYNVHVRTSSANGCSISNPQPSPSLSPLPICPNTSLNRGSSCSYRNVPIDIFDLTFNEEKVENYINKYSPTFTNAIKGDVNEFRKRVRTIINDSQAAGLNPVLGLGYWKSEGLFGTLSDREFGCAGKGFYDDLHCLLGVNLYSNINKLGVAKCARSADGNSIPCNLLKAERAKYEKKYRVSYPIRTFDDFAESYGPIEVDPNNCSNTYNTLIEVAAELGKCQISTQSYITTPRPDAPEYDCDKYRSDQVNIKWNPVVGAYKYKLFIDDLSDGRQLSVDDPNCLDSNLEDKCRNTTIPDTRENPIISYLKPGIKYKIWIQAYDLSNNLSEPSDKIDLVCGDLTPRILNSGRKVIDFPCYGSKPGYKPLPVRKKNSKQCFYSATTCYDNDKYDVDFTCDTEHLYTNANFSVKAEYLQFASDLGITPQTVSSITVNNQSLDLSGNSLSLTLASSETNIPVQVTFSNGNKINSVIKFIYSTAQSVKPPSLSVSCTNGVLTATWPKVSDALSYELRGGKGLTDRPSDNIWENFPESDKIIGRQVTNCSSNICTYTTSQKATGANIQNGDSYFLWIHSRNSSGTISDAAKLPSPITCSSSSQSNSPPAQPSSSNLPSFMEAECRNGVINISWTGSGSSYELRGGMNLTKEQILDGTTWDNGHPNSNDLAGRNLTQTSFTKNVGASNQFYTVWIHSRNSNGVLSDRVFYPNQVYCR